MCLFLIHELGPSHRPHRSTSLPEIIGLRGCIYNHRASRSKKTITIQQENDRDNNCALLNRDVGPCDAY